MAIKVSLAFLLHMPKDARATSCLGDSFSQTLTPKGRSHAAGERDDGYGSPGSSSSSMSSNSSSGNNSGRGGSRSKSSEYEYRSRGKSRGGVKGVRAFHISY